MTPSPVTPGHASSTSAPTPPELIGCYRTMKDLAGADLLTFASLTPPVVRELFATADALKGEFRRGRDRETGDKETGRGEQGKKARTNPPQTPSRSDGARGERAVAGASGSLRSRGLGSHASVMAGKTAVLLFEKPSLRTKMSFETGIGLLGGRSIFMDHSAQKLGEREAVKDYARNLERWVDCIIARVFSQKILYELAAHARVPVINALSDRFHPCQALADLFTVAEVAAGMGKGGTPLQEMRLAYVGDGNNVCHSLMHAATLAGMSVTVVTPKGYAPAEDVTRECEAFAKAAGAKVTISTDLAAVEGHDAVYTDVWVSMGQTGGVDEVTKRRKVFAKYQVNADLMARASKGLSSPSVFMHCLPAQRGLEVTDDVIDAPTSIVYDQAENRMWAQNALLVLVFGY